MFGLRRFGYFMLTNFLIMTVVGFLASLVNFWLYGTANPPNGRLTFTILLSLMWGMGGAIVSLLLCKYSAKKRPGLEVLNPESVTGSEKKLVYEVHELAREAGLKTMPEVAIYNSSEINAFATGPTRNNSLVAVSTGLLQKMNAGQVRGVLAHEVAHIANGDMVTLTLIQGVVNSFVIFFSRIIAFFVVNAINNALRSNDNRRGGGMGFMGHFVYMFVYQLIQNVLCLFGMVVVAYFSRRREYRADRGGAQYGGHGNMVSALQALQQQFEPQQTTRNKKPDAMASFKIANFSKGGLASLLSTHPPLEKRIQALRAQI